MSDERTAMDQVGRYWDAVARGDGAPDPALDPALARTIHRVHGLAATPSVGARERVWQSVLANAEAARRQEEGSMLRALMPNGRAVDVPGVGIPEGAPSVRQRWFAAPLATAALVLLTLVGSYMVFGPGRGSRQEEPPVFIPAIEATPATPEAAEAPVAAFVWQAEGDPAQPLDDPVRVAIDPQGNIWVNDGQHGRFQIFAPDGSFLEAWGAPGAGEGQFDFVGTGLFGGYGGGGMAFDADGNLYVADPGNYRIQKFGPDRAFVTSWGSMGQGDGQFSAVTDVAVDAQGRVFVTDEGRDDVQVFDVDGNFLTTWGDPEEGWLPQPSGITIDADGNLWIAHFSQSRVQKYTPDGTLLATVGEYGRGPGQFGNPSDVAVDSLGQVYVADWGGAQVQVFDDEGRFLAAWGELGLDEGQFMGSNNAVPDGAGNVYVTEDGNDRLQKFRLLPPLAVDDVPAASTPVADSGAIAEVVWETRGGPDLPLSYPGFLALDLEGNLWIPDSGNDRYQIFSPDGEFLEVWGESGSGDSQFEFERELFHSSSIAFAPDGSFYITDPGNVRVQKFGPDRVFVTAWGEEGSGPGQFDLMNGIAVDAQGRVYVTDDGRSDVQVFDADGAHLRTIGERGFNDGQFMFSMGSAVAIDPAGNVVVSDSSNQRLQTFSPDGELLSMLTGGPRKDELQQPGQVAIDGEGRVFVASPHLRQVQVFAADGAYLGAIGTANPTAWAEGEIPSGDFLVATGVVLDGQGSIYVADYEDYRVQKFRLLPPIAPD